VDISPHSKISHHLDKSYFYDCYTRDVKPNDRTALDIYLELMQNTPSWVNRLMRLRNAIVSKLGLKDLGTLSNFENANANNHYKVGDRLGIFSIYSLSDEEIILEDNDKHLNVKVSFYLEPRDVATQITLQTSTVVHVKNWFGKLYMFFVMPVHKIIVPSVINKLS